MDTSSDTKPQKDGLDSFIKVLTIIKLLMQVAFYGIMLGSIIWLLLNNPLPGLIENIQSQVMGGSFGK